METAIFISQENLEKIKNEKLARVAQASLDWFLSSDCSLSIPKKFARVEVEKGIRKSVYLPERYKQPLQEIANKYNAAKHRVLSEIVKKYIEKKGDCNE